MLGYGDTLIIIRQLESLMLPCSEDVCPTAQVQRAQQQRGGELPLSAVRRYR